MFSCRASSTRRRSRHAQLRRRRSSVAWLTTNVASPTATITMEAADDGFSNAEFFGMVDRRPGADGSSKKKGKKKGGFAAMGLSTAIYRSVMRKGYRMPTPIQRRAIRTFSGEDVVAMARTGSGKTPPSAAALRAAEGALDDGRRARGGARRRASSRCRRTSLRASLALCGAAAALRAARRRRRDGGAVRRALAQPRRADRDARADAARAARHAARALASSTSSSTRPTALFEMGFAVQIAGIMATMPDERQCLLFSATMPSILADFTRARLHEPRLIRLDLETKLSDALSVAFFKVRPHEKAAALVILLQSVLPRDQQTIVFASTRHHVEMLHELLQKAGLDPCCIYGSLDAAARKIALGKFRAGKSKLLLVTDVAARGIDVPLLDNVVNFDFVEAEALRPPRRPRRRAGRTGRALSSSSTRSSRTSST